jgi:hypothetical protein
VTKKYDAVTNSAKHRQTCAAGHADRRREPNACGGGQTPHDVTLNKNQTPTDEADTTDDLRRDTRRIEND